MRCLILICIVIPARVVLARYIPRLCPPCRASLSPDRVPDAASRAVAFEQSWLMRAIYKNIQSALSLKIRACCERLRILLHTLVFPERQGYKKR